MAKKIKHPKGWFQPTQEWDPGFPGVPGQIPGIAEQLTRGFGGSVADNMDYLGQMYQPMFADKKSPYVAPPADGGGGGIGLDDPGAAQQIADMFRTRVVSHMPGQPATFGSFIGGKDPKNAKQAMKWLKKNKNRPTQVGGTFSAPPSYDPYSQGR
jgi:hypothetical protein